MDEVYTGITTDPYWVISKINRMAKDIEAHNKELRGILERLKALEGRAGIVTEDKDGEA